MQLQTARRAERKFEILKRHGTTDVLAALPTATGTEDRVRALTQVVISASDNTCTPETTDGQTNMPKRFMCQRQLKGRN